MNVYAGKERRSPLSDEQIDFIAERAAQKALDKIYSEVGRGMLTKLAWGSGIVMISLFIWLAKSGKLVL